MSSASRSQAESNTRMTGTEHDDLWLLSEDYEQWMTQCISELLGLDLAQSLVDLGGGSGRFSSLLACSNPHLQEVFCVDPDPGMLMAAETRKGITPKCMSADEYVASQSPC